MFQQRGNRKAKQLSRMPFPEKNIKELDALHGSQNFSFFLFDFADREYFMGFLSCGTLVFPSSARERLPFLMEARLQSACAEPTANATQNIATSWNVGVHCILSSEP
jgi:hypothetical protein